MNSTISLQNDNVSNAVKIYQKKNLIFEIRRIKRVKVSDFQRSTRENKTSTLWRKSKNVNWKQGGDDEKITWRLRRLGIVPAKTRKYTQKIST